MNGKISIHSKNCKETTEYCYKQETTNLPRVAVFASGDSAVSRERVAATMCTFAGSRTTMTVTVTTTIPMVTWAPMTRDKAKAGDLYITTPSSSWPCHSHSVLRLASLLCYYKTFRGKSRVNIRYTYKYYICYNDLILMYTKNFK